VREIRTLRAMWRALETELRQFLYGHEEGNLGYKPRRSLRAPRQCSTLPGARATQKSELSWGLFSAHEITNGNAEGDDGSGS
jgi:hypothetical protein